MAYATHNSIFNGKLNTAAGVLEFVDGKAEITDEQAALFQKHPVSDIQVFADEPKNPDQGGGDEKDGDPADNKTTKAPPKKPQAKA